MNKKIIVVHSGGMDSSICLALAVKQYGAASVLSLSFDYGQRHAIELQQASLICKTMKVDQKIIALDFLNTITQNALTHHDVPIEHLNNTSPNTLVVGRNGLMARIAAIYAHSLSIQTIVMGIIEVEAGNSGYRDCSRAYFDLMEKILRIDLNNTDFKIETPLVYLTKAETLAIAHDLGWLDFFLKNTVSCYEGILGNGCRQCPACILRHQGIEEFKQSHNSAHLT